MKKVTVVFEDDELYTALKVQAARANRPLKELVAEAIGAWLEAQEEVEDAGAFREAIAEYKEKGGVPWEEVRDRARTLLVERGREEGHPRPAAESATG